MNFPTNKPSQGGVGNAGAVGFGEPGAASAQSFTVGEIGFGPSWDDEPSLRDMYDQACRTIVRMECEAEETKAHLATYEVERGILEKEMRRLRERVADMTLQNNELREVMAEIVTWVEDDLRETVDAGYRKAVERAQKLTEGMR